MLRLPLLDRSDPEQDETVEAERLKEVERHLQSQRPKTQFSVLLQKRREVQILTLGFPGSIERAFSTSSRAASSRRRPRSACER